MQKLVTVDSSVLVSAFVVKETRHQEAKEVLNKIVDNSYFAILPTTILVEVISAVTRRTGDELLAYNILEYLKNLESILFINIEENIAINASNFSIQTHLRGMDSIVVYISQEFETELITYDQEMNDINNLFNNN